MTSSNSIQARRWLPVAAVAVVALLAACDRSADTVGNTSTDAGTPTAQAGNEVRQDTRETGATMADTAKDIAITTEVKTLLARDDQLSALQIDVDTNAGQVVLQGTAPTAAASTRASDLARGVGGVLGVDNRLQIASN